MRKPRIVICDAAGALHSELRRYLDAVDLVVADNPSEALKLVVDASEIQTPHINLDLR